MLRHEDTIHHVDGIGSHVMRTQEEIFRREHGSLMVTKLDAGDLLVLDGLSTYTISSVVSYVLSRGGDPVEAIDRARRLGHELVFIVANGAMIYSGPRMEPKPHVMVTIGMPVLFQGNVYEIVKAPNHNLGLRLMAAVSA